jgi:N-acetylglucosaminyl-diphospho-decaprenol L-rhamnosyltransferase
MLKTVAIDVVVVSYNSESTLRACVEPLLAAEGVRVVVVDNDSSDGSVASVVDLPLVVRREVNGGFAYGCNRGWRDGSAPLVLFLNPDARIRPESLRRLAERLGSSQRIGLAAPRIVDGDGELELSLRHFPRVCSTLSRALFLHRVFPRAEWSDEDVRDPEAYSTAHAADWVSGACVLVRRAALEQIDGWDEGFFLYGEDIDLCRRLWSAGYEVWYEPAARATHVGGVSGPRANLRPVLVESRIRYACKHGGRVGALFERLAIGLEELTHAALTTKGVKMRVGHVRALGTVVGSSPRRPTANSATGRSSVEVDGPSD